MEFPFGRPDRVDATLGIELLQNRPQRGQVLDPLDDAARLVERRDRVRANVEIAAASFGLLFETLVDHREELHDAVVDAQVVFGLAQERIQLAVRAADGHFFGLLQRAHHHHVVLETTYVDELEWVRVVRAKVLIAARR